MRIKTVLVMFLLLSCIHLRADCTGCCSYHGGVVCFGGVTKCADGTSLSQVCQDKHCNKCGGTGGGTTLPPLNGTSPTVLKILPHISKVGGQFETEHLLTNGCPVAQDIVLTGYRENGNELATHEQTLGVNK